MNSVETASKGLFEILELWKVPIVSDGFLGLSPNIFHCIELGRVGWQEVEFNEVLLAFQPFKNSWSLVIL